MSFSGEQTSKEKGEALSVVKPWDFKGLFRDYLEGEILFLWIVFSNRILCLIYLQNEQLRQDIIDYQKQIDSQKETLLSRRGEDSDYRSQLSKKNYELVQYLVEIQVK